MLGRVSEEKTIPQLKKFAESGGVIIAGGSSTGLAELFDLALTPGLTEIGPNGTELPLPREKFYVPGSILQAKVNTASPLAYGVTPLVDMFFENSPVFRLAPDAALKSVQPVAWFEGKSVLRSGWAWGQEHLDGTVGIVEAKVGEGKVFLMGPEVTFRAQPHGTFKFLFNGIYYGTAEPVTLD
jgi:hypothetical protein